jgi:hypothetical protein
LDVQREGLVVPALKHEGGGEFAADRGVGGLETQGLAEKGVGLGKAVQLHAYPGHFYKEFGRFALLGQDAVEVAEGGIVAPEQDFEPGEPQRVFGFPGHGDHFLQRPQEIGFAIEPGVQRDQAVHGGKVALQGQFEPGVEGRGGFAGPFEDPAQRPQILRGSAALRGGLHGRADRGRGMAGRHEQIAQAAQRGKILGVPFHVTAQIGQGLRGLAGLQGDVDQFLDRGRVGRDRGRGVEAGAEEGEHLAVAVERAQQVVAARRE